MAGPTSAERVGRRFNGMGWTPTVGYLVVLIALEIAAYTGLRWAFRTVHGG